ncbi:MAG: HNH endonuclease, partial [Candidatus Babeliaceae bacterium]|nr:HNH endonuclease [Candidatus Babeliaceae bacterium]
MGFPKEIKEKALIAAARRCCVCKEFKGRNIEVHHIIPKKEGGENTFENAIPLCFDCHSEAGHYDKFHPRGTKYSKDELRGHRDIWYEIVKKGNFANPSIDVVQSYYLTSEFPIIWEMIEGNFEDFPLDQVKLLKNELLSFLQTLKKYQKQQSRKSDIYGNSYKDLDEYQTNFPQAQNVRGKWTDHWERTPSEDE